MPAQLSPPEPAPDYYGFVEQADETCLRGWAIDRARLPAAAQVAVLGADGPIALARADRPRPDVAQAGFPVAACGFELRLPRGARPQPCVVFWPDRVPLAAAPDVALGMPPPAPRGRSLAVVTSWHPGCGIADYARAVVGALSDRFDITVFAIDTAAERRQGGVRVDPCWHDSDAGMELLHERVALQRPSMVLVEHHPGLLAWPRLAALIEHAHGCGARVYARLHTVRSNLVALREIRPALRLCDAVLVHTENDLAFVAATMPGVRAHTIPHGVAGPPRIARQSARRNRASFHVGAFGFMHAYKGIAQHLMALHLVRRHVPALRATLLHALTDNPATAATAVECFALRDRLGLADAVTIDTRLLPMHTVAARLAGCDALVFPYQDSAESASGAACALAALGVPIVSTPSANFADLEAVCHVTEGSDAYAIAAKLLALAADREALRATLPGLAAYARANAWPAVANCLANVMLPAEA